LKALPYSASLWKECVRYCCEKARSLDKYPSLTYNHAHVWNDQYSCFCQKREKTDQT